MEEFESLSYLRPMHNKNIFIWDITFFPLQPLCNLYILHSKIGIMFWYKLKSAYSHVLSHKI